MRTRLPLNPEGIDVTPWVYPLPGQKKASWSTDIVTKLGAYTPSSAAEARKYPIIPLGLEGMDLMMGNATPRTLVIVRESLIEPVESSRRLHEAIKERMRQRNPSLKIQLSHKEVVKLMDELSEKVARGMPFATWQETEAFMRGEDRYDFERQQYLHH